MHTTKAGLRSVISIVVGIWIIQVALYWLSTELTSVVSMVTRIEFRCHATGHFEGHDKTALIFLLFIPRVDLA